ncbi:MAG: metallophosphoesterase [archaeon]|nr:MAG: metallophosphoesterase [archaeon]
MRILVIADAHGKFEAINKIMEEVENEEYDVIIAQGDFTDMFDKKREFRILTIADVVLQKLMVPNRRLFCVPGNHDPYEIIDLLEDYGINLHNKKTKMGELTFVGWGGASTPFNTNFEPTEEETKEAVTGLLKGIRGKWILVSHAPPKGTTLDILKTKTHVGSAAIRRLIEKNKPTLALTAHIHENKGSDKLGETTIFYPGPAYEGFYGFVDIEDQKVSCEIRKAPG